MVANFRSYEGQLRLLTAVVAAHPELKLNYKETAKHFGSDWTESGIEHFFRPIKKNSKAIQEHVRRGEDAKHFTHQAIHKYFGDSTPDGIQFQFRSIKADANALRQGKEPAAPGTSTPKTPRTTGGRKRAAPSTGKSTASKKAKQDSAKKFAESLSTADLDDDSEDDVAPIDMTPTKPRINEQKLRDYQKSEGWIPADPPALEFAQAAATPEEEDDVKIVTPADAGPNFSFVQSNNWPSSAASGGMPSFDTNPFHMGNSYVSGEAQKGVEFEDDDLAGEC